MTRSPAAHAGLGRRRSRRWARVPGENDPVDPEAERATAFRRARHRLTALAPNAVRAPGDFERISLPASDGDVLRDLLLAERASFVIEIGLAYGSSALAIAEALVPPRIPDATHVIIDAFQDHFDNIGWDTLRETGLDAFCSLYRERSQLVLPRLITEGFVADAAFVDGSHIFHNVFVDLAFLRELVRPGGLIILDDCHWPSVDTAARYFELNTGWQPIPVPPKTRLRGYRVPDPPFDPAFQDFTPFECRPTN